MRCINPTDPTESEGEIQEPTPGGFCGLGGTPVELPEWQKTYLAEFKNVHRLLYEVTKGIESQKVWRDLVWSEALGKPLAAIDPRIKKIRLGEVPEEEAGTSWDDDHKRTIRVAMQLLFLDYIKSNQSIRKMFTSTAPARVEGEREIPESPVGWNHFRLRATTSLEIDFASDVEIASEKSGRTHPEPRPMGLRREPWWAWYERQPRSKNPRVSYWDDYSNSDVFTAHPSPTHLRGLKNSQQIEIEPWLDKSPLPTVVADEMFVRDVARKTNGTARRCRNPWFLGHSREGIKEVFWSKKKPTPCSHGDRYLSVVGPERTQIEAEVRALKGQREGGGFYQVLGRHAKPRSFHSYRGDPQSWPGHYEEFGYEWPPEGGRRQERGVNPRSMNPKDKAFALKHNIPESTWNDATFQRELRSYIERHGTYPRSVYRVRVPEGFPRYMSAWGKSPNVLYDAPHYSNKGKRVHHFGEDKGKGRKPWLVSSQEKGPRFLAYVGGEFEADGEWIRY
jgi:hypothetical protein